MSGSEYISIIALAGSFATVSERQSFLKSTNEEFSFHTNRIVGR